MAILSEIYPDITRVPCMFCHFPQQNQGLRFKGYNGYRAIQTNEITNERKSPKHMKTNNIITNIYPLYPLYYYVIDIVNVFGFILWVFKWVDSLDLGGRNA